MPNTQTTTTDKILRFLHTGRTLTAKTGANRFGVPAPSVRARISELNTLGYNIYTFGRRRNGRTISVYSF